MSAGLVLMADNARADKGDKDRGSATDLSGVTQNWDKNLPSASRFTVLADFGGAAVRDNNTGLVWEKSVSATAVNWETAGFNCLNKAIGGTFGWRLPSVVEFASLIDPSLSPPFVPTSIFIGVQNIYWSSTASRGTTERAWYVAIDTPFAIVRENYKTESSFVWCVRGPMSADAY